MCLKKQGSFFSECWDWKGPQGFVGPEVWCGWVSRAVELLTGQRGGNALRPLFDSITLNEVAVAHLNLFFWQYGDSWVWVTSCVFLAFPGRDEMSWYSFCPTLCSSRPDPKQCRIVLFLPCSWPLLERGKRKNKSMFTFLKIPFWARSPTSKASEAENKSRRAS